MNLLYYLAEANLYLGVFYLAYCLLLTKETYYQLTRAYLLFSCVAAFILPILQIGALKPVEAAITTTVNYTIPEYTEPMPITNHVNIAPVMMEHHLTLQDYLIYIYLLGATVLFAGLLVKLFSLYRLMRNAQTVHQFKYKLVYLPETGVAFSFFNYLFIGNNAPGANTIIRHELVHIRQKHSADIIFLEVLKVINWFNPFIYLLQNSLKTVHEYIADEQTAALETDALAYSTFLVNNAYGAGGPSFTHSFFNYNLLKRRIIMLNQQRSGSLARLKYLVTVPICAALLCSSTLAFSKTYGWVDLDPAKPANEEINKFAPPIVVRADHAEPAQQRQIKFPPKVKFAPPSVANDYFAKLNAYLSKTVHFDNIVSNTPGGLVVVSFNVTADHKIADAKIARSSGSRFDAIALQALKAYKGTVNSKAGERKFIFDFYDGDDTPEEQAIINESPETRAGYLVILRPARKPKLVIIDGKIGYPKPDETVSADSMAYVAVNTLWAIKKWGEIARDGVYIYTGHGTIIKKAQQPLKYQDEHGGRVSTGKLTNAMMPIKEMMRKDPGLLFIVDGKKYDLHVNQINDKTLIAMTCDLMTVYEKGNAYAKSKWGNDIGKVVVLQGHAAAKLVDMPSAQPTNETAHTVPQSFYNNMRTSIRYPADARNNNIWGSVVATFTVANNLVTNVKIVKGIGHGVNEEVTRALQNYNPDNMSAGNYAAPFYFGIAGNETSASVYQAKNMDYTKTYKARNNELVALNETVIWTYKDATPFRDGDTTTQQDWQNFGIDLSRNIKYLAKAREKNILGKVIALFSVDADHKIQYIKIIRTPWDDMNAEVIRSLKINKYLNILKPGVQYILPVSFTLGINGGAPGETVVPGVLPPGIKSDPAKNIYNPNNIDIPDNAPGTLMLNEVVIRGYITKN